MAKFEFKYGKKAISVNISDEGMIGVLQGKTLAPLRDTAAKIKRTLNYPIDSPKFHDVFKSGDKVAIVVSDRTRNSGAKFILPVVINELNSIGIKDEDIFAVLACGTHRTHTKEEHTKLVGEEVIKRVRIFDHDCDDEKNLVELGTTSRGNKVKLDKRVVEADKVILTGAITYHYFAGYGGGRKSVLPGISAFETIQTNHKLLIKDGKVEKNCTTGRLEGNPVHEDMIEAAKMLGPDFLVNTIMTSDGRVAAVFAGDFIAAHLAGCEFLNANLKVDISQKSDLVIAASGGGGKDLNFVQSHKAMENASYALKDGGVMVLIAESSEGFPSDEYLKWINLGSSKAILDELAKNFTIGGHTVYAAFRKAEKFKIIWVSKLDSRVISKMGIIPRDNIAAALDEAYRLAGENPSTYVMPQGYNTLPNLI
ncbi:nickel-dependent lactate racemase [Candidatus Margulisiibacteriota bacterium]